MQESIKTTQLAIIGGGPAGMAAAMEAYILRHQGYHYI